MGVFDTEAQAALANEIARLWHALRDESSEEELNLSFSRDTRDIYDEAAGEGFATVHEAVKACVVEGRRLQPEPSSGYRGVTAHGKRWKSEIRNNGKLTHLGIFDMPEQAARAYDLAMVWHELRPRSRQRGGFKLNFDLDAYDDEVGLYK